MANLETFRSETRSWLEANAPASLIGRPGNEIEGVWGGKKWTPEVEDQRVWLEVAAEKGFTAPTWPTEYGGGGLDKDEAKVLTQEMRSLKIPPPLIGFGLTMIGPTLLQFGNEEQKKQHLPLITQGAIRWCQGYSEPGSGSDLASPPDEAPRRDGDHLHHQRHEGLDLLRRPGRLDLRPRARPTTPTQSSRRASPSS